MILQLRCFSRCLLIRGIDQHHHAVRDNGALILSMTIALLVTTYNSPEYLKRVLESVAIQTVMPQEVLVADDGSSSPTADVVLWAKTELRLNVTHCWQRDNDFRVARSRNLALSRVQSDYVVMIDGDCILPHTFLEWHQSLAQRGKMVAGNRRLLLPDRVDARRNVLTSQDLQGYKFLRLPLGMLRDMQPKNWKSVRTCNLGCFLHDIRRVEGFDESFIGWGLEDSDLIVRLLRTGVVIRSGRFGVTVGHLYHKKNIGTMRSPNEQRFKELFAAGRALPKRSILRR